MVRSMHGEVCMVRSVDVRSVDVSSVHVGSVCVVEGAWSGVCMVRSVHGEECGCEECGW